MAGINKITLLGHLGKDPEIKNLDSGSKVAVFSMATTESYKDKNGNKVDNTEWHNIVLWKGLADIAEKYLKKGSQVYIEGKIKTRMWEDKGEKRYRTEIIGNHLLMLGNKRQDNSSIAGASESDIENTGSDDLPF